MGAEKKALTLIRELFCSKVSTRTTTLRGVAKMRFLKLLLTVIFDDS